ncbi:hypothetical protein JZK55_00580 [Dissulfurispira thermophila]|uniref:Uncharacterized protein n=2 Tax=root TaxID=1 RepID=A0A7G1GYZ8_9BACT|nr:hypothetical protein [Dissulfurispira thermophila]BCB95136.1 hypothetical protein JZK55_00580 [Dissulfurispira thermophila]
MELYREIRAFYIKLPYSYKIVTPDTIDNLWELSKGFAINAIDISKNNEVLIHSDIEFNLSNWNEAIGYLRAVITLLNAKSGHMLVRKIIGSKNSVRTELEGYKITKRGVYNTNMPESPDFIEDVIRLSGRNKKLQQIDAMERLFRFIEEQEKDKDNEDIG